MILDKRLIVALDVPNMAKLSNLVIGLGESVTYYKVGMELFYSCGAEVVRYLKGSGKSIFLDLKLHDIPNTVGSSLAALTELGVDMLNVHATGGFQMMKFAAQTVKARAAELGIKAPKLIAVTVLTSISPEEWQELNYAESISAQVIHLAKLAKKAGLDGVVASPQEAAAIRAACGEEFLIVTPGIRPAGSEVNDQSRIATPKAAIENGATHLVIGRPITKATDLKRAVQDIVKEMQEAGK